MQAQKPQRSTRIPILCRTTSALEGALADARAAIFAARCDDDLETRRLAFADVTTRSATHPPSDGAIFFSLASGAPSR